VFEARPVVYHAPGETPGGFGLHATATPELGRRSLLVAASLVVVIAGLKAASALLVPFMVAVFIAMISLPLLNGLEARGVPSGLAVLVTLLVPLVIVAGILVLVGGSVQGFVDRVDDYKILLQQKATTFTNFLQDLGIDVPPDVARRLIKPDLALDLVARTLRAAQAVMTNLLLVLLTMVFILSEAAGFPRKLEAAFGRGGEGWERFQGIKKEVQRYLAIKTVISLATGLTVGFGMWLIGVDFPLLWGLLAFLLNYIPNLGSILAAIPPVLLAIVQFGAGRALLVAAVFLMVNLGLGNFLEPRIMGRRLGLSTLVVFMSLVFWGWVWGPVGMLLSVPLTMVLKIMLENTKEFRWVAVLLDQNPRQA
jgi:predicted PurR-regulated permease PerM